LNLVALGGGTGLSALLTGLKEFVRETGRKEDQSNAKYSGLIQTLTAIVTVSDDGGSSGRLREEFQMLPPGDIRNCMLALSEDEQLMSRLFRHRFRSKGDLQDHSFGNLFLTALTAVTGDFLEAIKLSSEVLAIKGRIFPATMSDVGLVADLADGSFVQGESNISKSKTPIKKLRMQPEIVYPLKETTDAIAEADMITIGPGSLFTSIIPNLLVKGIPEALSQSKAVKVYICNIMTQPGETVDYTVKDHVQAVFDYARELSLDYVLVNSTPIPESMRLRYQADGAFQIGLNTCNANSNTTIVSQHNGSVAQVICKDLIEVRTIQMDGEEREVLRHDPHKLSRLLITLTNSNKKTQILPDDVSLARSR
jgi:uncharacterized cofD-like protein